ncbi:MAG: sulfite exporter TauE/SafE family protein [Gaiellales bacterium]
MNLGMTAAGFGVGLLVGLTGMGAGSLMTPILISVFGIPPTTAVGTDLVYAAITKAFGAARHHQLKNVNKELALWMATGSVPAAFLGTFMLYNVFGNINAWLPDVIGITLVLVGIAVAIRTFVTIRGLWDASKLPTDGELTTRHKTYAVIIGVVFGFILGLTSVGSGVFFGMTLVTLFPLSARKVVGTDLLHAFLVTCAAGLGTILFGFPNYAYVAAILIGSIPGILVGSHFTHRLPERALRGSIASVLALSGLKLLGAF